MQQNVTEESTDEECSDTSKLWESGGNPFGTKERVQCRKRNRDLRSPPTPRQEQEKKKSNLREAGTLGDEVIEDIEEIEKGEIEIFEKSQRIIEVDRGTTTEDSGEAGNSEITKHENGNIPS